MSILTGPRKGEQLTADELLKRITFNEGRPFWFKKAVEAMRALFGRWVSL